MRPSRSFVSWLARGTPDAKRRSARAMVSAANAGDEAATLQIALIASQLGDMVYGKFEIRDQFLVGFPCPLCSRVPL